MTKSASFESNAQNSAGNVNRNASNPTGAGLVGSVSTSHLHPVTKVQLGRLSQAKLVVSVKNTRRRQRIHVPGARTLDPPPVSGETINECLLRLHKKLQRVEAFEKNNETERAVTAVNYARVIHDELLLIVTALVNTDGAIMTDKLSDQVERMSQRFIDSVQRVGADEQSMLNFRKNQRSLANKCMRQACIHEGNVEFEKALEELGTAHINFKNAAESNKEERLSAIQALQNRVKGEHEHALVKQALYSHLFDEALKHMALGKEYVTAYLGCKERGHAQFLTSLARFMGDWNQNLHQAMVEEEEARLQNVLNLNFETVLVKAQADGRKFFVEAKTLMSQNSFADSIQMLDKAAKCCTWIMTKGKIANDAKGRVDKDGIRPASPAAEMVEIDSKLIQEMETTIMHVNNFRAKAFRMEMKTLCAALNEGTQDAELGSNCEATHKKWFSAASRVCECITDLATAKHVENCGGISAVMMRFSKSPGCVEHTKVAVDFLCRLHKMGFETSQLVRLGTIQASTAALKHTIENKCNVDVIVGPCLKFIYHLCGGDTTFVSIKNENQNVDSKEQENEAAKHIRPLVLRCGILQLLPDIRELLMHDEDILCMVSGILLTLVAEGPRQSHIILEDQLANTTVVATLCRHPEFVRHSLIAMDFVLALFNSLLPTGVLPPEFFIVKKGAAAKAKKPPSSLELLKATANNVVAAIVTAMKKSSTNLSIQFRGVSCLQKIALFDFPVFNRVNNGAVSTVITSIVPFHPQLVEELLLVIQAIPNVSSREQLNSMLTMVQERGKSSLHRLKKKGLTTFSDPASSFVVSRKEKTLFIGAKLLRRVAHPSSSGCIVNKGLQKIPQDAADAILSEGSRPDPAATLTLPCVKFQKILQRFGGMSENEAYLCSMYFDSEMTGEINCHKLLQYLNHLRCERRMLLSVQEVHVAPWMSKAEQRIQAKRGVVCKTSKMVLLTAFDPSSDFNLSVLMGKKDILNLRSQRRNVLTDANYTMSVETDSSANQPVCDLILECIALNTKWEQYDAEGGSFLQNLAFEFGGHVWAQK
jgi:hypothetical protein